MWQRQAFDRHHVHLEERITPSPVCQVRAALSYRRQPLCLSYLTQIPASFPVQKSRLLSAFLHWQLAPSRRGRTALRPSSHLDS